MSALNLRNVPNELMRELRAAAAMAGQPFHPFCVALLEEAMRRRAMEELREVRRYGQPAPAKVTVHPPIETLVPATQQAMTELATAAVTYLNLPAPPEGAIGRQLNGVDLPPASDEIEIT